MSASVHDADKRWIITTTLPPSTVYGTFRRVTKSKKAGFLKLWRQEDASRWTQEPTAIARARHGTVVREHSNFPVVVCVANNDGKTTMAVLYVANTPTHTLERRRVISVLQETVDAIRSSDRSAFVMLQG